MFKGFGDLANLVKSAREVQGKIESFKQSLESAAVEGVAGGGLVRVHGRADGSFRSVELDPETVASGDREMLQDLILAALTQFHAKATEIRKEKLAGFTAEIGLPPGIDLGL